MSNIVDLTIYDGQSTPVLRTFNVQNAQGSDTPASFLEKTAGVRKGYLEITAFSKRNKKSGITRHSFRVILPTLAVTAPASGSGIQPVPVVSYTVQASLEVLIPDAATAQNKLDIVAYIKNLFGEPILANMVTTDSPLF